MATSVEEQVVTAHAEDHIAAAAEDQAVAAPIEDQVEQAVAEEHVVGDSAEDHTIPTEDHTIEDHTMTAPVDDHPISAPVEDQVEAAVAEDHVVSASAENNAVDVPAEDHTIPDPAEDHAISDLAENHTITAPAEDHTIASPAEDHPIAAPSEDHTVAAPSEDHTVAAQGENHVLDVPVAEDHMVDVPVTEDRTVAEDQMVDFPVTEDHTMAEDHMVDASSDDRIGEMVDPPHELIDHRRNVQMDHMVEDHMVDVTIDDRMIIGHEEGVTVASRDELAIMAVPDDQRISALDEEKLLIAPYEDDSRMLTPYAVKTPISYENIDLAVAETQPSKRRKKKSIVWEHFTIETVSPGCRRACCKQCKQTFAYSTGSKVAGTSHLKRHIAKGTCQDRSQMSPFTPGSRTSDTPKRRYRTSATPQVAFDADRCRHEIARMIIMHDYPLHMVEHPGFLTFVRNLQPQFNMVSFNTVQGDCVATYLMEKQHLIKFIEGIPGRVCLALDMWASSQSVGYVFITGHFIDSDWKLQRRLLNVVMEPYPNSDAAFSHAVAVCLHDWSLENKLFSLTVNQPLAKTAVDTLRPLLAIKNPLVLDGQLLVGNCLARTFSGIAKDVFYEAREIIQKVRESVKYVKTSDSQEEKFLDLKQHLQVPSNRTLSVDDQTQWNTTYQMLVSASELKEVFFCLNTSDPDYKGAPSSAEWKQIETICNYMKFIFEAANILTSPNATPTPITFFHEVWKIQLELSRAAGSEDLVVSSLTTRMQDQINKYWKDCSLALATAVVMDPRFKMKLVEFSFNKIYGDEAPTCVKIVDDGVHELFREYVALPLPLTPTYEEGGTGDGGCGGEQSFMTDNGLTDFDAYIMETTSHQMKSELDQYLDESLLPRVQEFDVLGWWKLNKLKYPTLSKMARDILSIPVSTMAPDSVFCTEAKEMDGYRSSLRPETVEALICAKDWMQYGVADVSNMCVRMEF